MKIIILGVIFNILAYALIWLFGKISGSSENLQESLLSIFNWKSLSIVILANSFFGAAVFYYFKETQQAIAITLTLGAVVSFLMSVIFSGANMNIYNISGILLSVIGIFLMFK